LAEEERVLAEAIELVNEALAAPIPENESTAELEAKIADIDTINAKIRANADKAKAEADAEDFQRKKLEYDDAVEAVRQERRELLNTASMPLAELTIGKNDKGRPVLLYRGQPWDCMSGMERIRVAVSIVRKLKPECGFMLLDGMESFDLSQLHEFDTYLADQGLQAIATRVSRGDECAIVIEDGMAVQPGVEVASGVDATPAKSNLGSW
jgi:hypothetical protein